MSPERGKCDSVQFLLLDRYVSSLSSANSKSPSHLLLRRIRQPINQQILHHQARLLVDVTEEVSGTTAFVVGKFSFERFAALGPCCSLFQFHSFEGVVVVVRVDLEDDVLEVPASEVVEFVHAAACDHLGGLVRRDDWLVGGV
jgi:hypothetical protein